MAERLSRSATWHDGCYNMRSRPRDSSGSCAQAGPRSRGHTRLRPSEAAGTRQRTSQKTGEVIRTWQRRRVERRRPPRRPERRRSNSTLLDLARPWGIGRQHTSANPRFHVRPRGLRSGTLRRSTAAAHRTGMTAVLSSREILRTAPLRHRIWDWRYRARAGRLLPVQYGGPFMDGRAARFFLPRRPHREAGIRVI